MHRKITASLFIIAASLALSGCSTVLRSYIEVDLSSQVETRINANLSYVDKLYNAGLLTDKKADKLKKDIEKNGDQLVSAFKSIDKINSSKAMDMLKSTTGIAGFGWNENNTKVDGTKCRDQAVIEYAKACGYEVSSDKNGEYCDANDLMLSNALLEESSSIVTGWDIAYSWYINEKVDKDTAIDIVSMDNKTLNIDGNFTVCVLDSSKIAQTGNELDNIKEIFEKFTDSSGVLSEQATDELSRFYTELTDVTLFDAIDTSNLIATTKTWAPEHDGKLGYDMQITQGKIGVMKIRLNEFNQEAVDNLINMVSNKNGKYILCPKTSKAYLVEYPVSIIDEISTDGVNVTASLAKSELGINIKSGEILKYIPVSGQAMPSREVIGKGIGGYTSYLGTYGADNEKAESCSSFTILGDQKIEIEAGYNGQSIEDIKNTREITTAGIVLRDYLEASYAPGFRDNGENVVVFGRKFRMNIDGIDGDRIKLRNNGIAYMVDINGEEVKNADGDVVTLDAKQLMGLSNGIVNGNVGECDYYVNRLRQAGEENGKEVQIQSSNISKNPKITELKILASDSIKPVQRFPGNNIGSPDYTEEDNQPVMYAIGTCTDLFETGLYSTWMQSSSATMSLSWWNKWLETAGLSYRVSLQDTEEYLHGNYSYELSQEGIVLLDLNTVSKIQDDIDIINNQRDNSRRRAIFKALGVLLIAYASILMCCWVLDTQLGLGLNLYGALSFNKWEAIKYKSDIPIGERSSHYVSLGRMLLNTVVIMSIGTVLIRVNIVALIYTLIKSFGKFAEYITNLL